MDRMSRKIIAVAIIGIALIGCTVKEESDGDSSIRISKQAKEAGQKAVDTTKEALGNAAQATKQGAMSAKVNSTLRSAGSLTIEDLNVDTVGNEITIEGIVPTELQKKTAERLTKDIAGPDYTVVNKITVKSG